MAGFGSVTWVGEYMGAEIINKFWYRSTAWLPLQGNPFDDMLVFVDACRDAMIDQYLAIQPSTYTLLRLEGVGYDDAFNIVTSSPVMRTVNLPGDNVAYDTSGAYQSATLSLRCGEQVQINGLAKSKRNRGYLSIGPVGEPHIDAYGKLSATYLSWLKFLADAVDDTLTIVSPAVSLIPIRIHEVWTKVLTAWVLTGRTYSDINGYKLPDYASVRKSRMRRG